MVNKINLNGMAKIGNGKRLPTPVLPSEVIHVNNVLRFCFCF